MTVGYSDPNLSVGPHHDSEHIPALRRWVGRELSPGAALAMVHLLPPAALSSGTLLSGSLDVPCSGSVSRLLPQSQVLSSPRFLGTPWVDTVTSAELASCNWRDRHGHTFTRTSSGTRPLFFPLRTLMKPSCSSSEVTQIWMPGRERKGFSLARTSGDLQQKLLLTEPTGTPSWERRGGSVGRGEVGGGNVRKCSTKHSMQAWVWKQAQMQNIFWAPAL